MRYLLLPRIQGSDRSSIGGLPVQLGQWLECSVAEDHLRPLHTTGGGRREFTQRGAEGDEPEIVLGIANSRTLETIEEGGNVQHLRAVLHEVFVDQLPLGEGTTDGIGDHNTPPGRSVAPLSIAYVFKRVMLARIRPGSISWTSMPLPTPPRSMIVTRPPR